MKSTINPITRRCQICVNKGGRHFEMEIQVYLASYFAFFSQLLNKAFMDSLSHNIVALFLLVEHTVEVCAEKYATPCILQTHRGMQNTRRVLPFTKLSSEKPYYPPRFRVLSSIPFFGNSPFRLTRVRPLDGQRCRTEFQPFPLQILITLDGISRIASYISRVSRKLLPGRGTRNFDGQLTAILRA